MSRPWHACSPEEFVRVWQSADSIGAVALHLDIAEGSARSRASLYRRRGIPLKTFKLGLNVPELVELARAIGGQP